MSREDGTCRGCEHLVRGAACRALKGSWNPRTNPYTGDIDFAFGPHRLSKTRIGVDFLDYMRAADGPCGPDLKLFKWPWWKFWKRD